jgi:chemosensory pili system protein ChpC
MPAVQIEEVVEVSCVILPLRSAQLVVPATCIAEVLPWRSPTPLPDGPPWCAGTLNWHGAIVPVLVLEALGAEPEAPIAMQGRCLAVVNRMAAEAPWPFYALVVHGIPRLVQVAQVDLSAETAPEAPGELLRVQVGTELLVIPDLVGLERMLVALVPEPLAAQTDPT